jgi:hypothetical protein
MSIDRLYPYLKIGRRIHHVVALVHKLYMFFYIIAGSLKFKV